MSDFPDAEIIALIEENKRLKEIEARAKELVNFDDDLSRLKHTTQDEWIHGVDERIEWLRQALEDSPVPEPHQGDKQGDQNDRPA